MLVCRNPCFEGVFSVDLRCLSFDSFCLCSYDAFKGLCETVSSEATTLSLCAAALSSRWVFVPATPIPSPEPGTGPKCAHPEPRLTCVGVGYVVLLLLLNIRPSRARTKGLLRGTAIYIGSMICATYFFQLPLRQRVLTFWDDDVWAFIGFVQASECVPISTLLLLQVVAFAVVLMQARSTSWKRRGPLLCRVQLLLQFSRPPPSVCRCRGLSRQHPPPPPSLDPQLALGHNFPHQQLQETLSKLVVWEWRDAKPVCVGRGVDAPRSKSCNCEQ